MTFTFGTLCSGIEAASEAFLPLGAECRFVSEIEPHPCGVLADRHGAGKPMRMPSPDEAKDDKQRRDRLNAIKAVDRFSRWGNRIPNFGDLTQIDPDEVPEVDLLVAGFPCQDYSIAGLRKSLSGARGSLTLYGVMLIHELVRRKRIRSVLLEQVPDILNTKDNAFGALLGGIVGHDAPIVSPYLGGRWTNSGVADGPRGTAVWRIQDAQYAGVAQRRERLFLVGSFGNGPDPVEVLLERQGLSRDPPARRKAGEGIARPLAAGSPGSGGYRHDADTADNLIPSGDLAPSLRAQAQPSYRLDSDAYVGVAFGGNRTGGELDVHTALNASHTASGRQDFETETFIVEIPEVATALRARDSSKGVDSDCTDTLIAHALRAKHNMAHRADVDTLVPVTYSIMPQNSGKDYKAREVDVAQPLMAAGPVGGNQGGDYVVQPVAFNWQAGGDQSTLGFDPDADTTGTLHVGQVPAIAFSCKDHGADAGDISPTLRSMGHSGSHPNAGGQVAVTYAVRTGQTGANGIGVDPDVAHTLDQASPQAIAFSMRGREGGAMPEVEEGDVAPSLRAADGGSTRPFVAFSEAQITLKANRSNPPPGDPCHTLPANTAPATLASDMAVRRITCVEGERLQGFRDNYTLIDWPTGNRKGEDLAETVSYLIGHGFTPEEAERLAQSPDGPRYKEIGNSKAVPLVRAIGRSYAAALARYLSSEAGS